MPMEPHKPDPKTIFCEALDRPAGPDRRAYLEGACGGNLVLQAQVEGLLDAHERAGGFLGSAPGLSASISGGGPDEGATATASETALASEPHPPGTNGGSTSAATDSPHGVSSPVSQPIAFGPGSRIGPYKLLQEIGQGGMGTVFMAEQDKPVRRRVALKVIKSGMDSAQVMARFEAERQALALMDHPNIAKVFDAGTTGDAAGGEWRVAGKEENEAFPRSTRHAPPATPSGRPFFVMELVKGIPITTYCDEARFSPKERLELFIPVCQAIQHAHQKGIIHRDIKPSNVLVTLIDGRSVPKVIDFGIAKATDQRLTERSLFTEFGSILGTLEYMSPEQANLSGMDVDTRTDVFALGVLLYELLTGTTPLERVQLREAGYAEILRRIKEEEPPKPSTRLSNSGDRLASIAAVRGTEPSRLRRAVRGDLDWIVMKALEKSRTRRYETASGFARDLQRYLDGDAVEACPPSGGYRLRKFIGKHRGAIATASAFAGLLIAGAGISLAMALRATRAEQAARQERDRAIVAESQAKAQEQEARHSAEESHAVLKFLEDRVLAAARSAGQEGGLGRDVTIRQAVDAAQPRLTATFKHQPMVEAAIRKTLGDTYFYLGEGRKAIRELERAAELLAARLGPDHPRTLTSRNNLAQAFLAAGRHAEAITLLEAIIRAKELKLGADHPETLSSRNNLAAGYLAIGRTAAAIALDEATLKTREMTLGPDHPDTLFSRSNLGAAYLDSGRIAEAIALDEATLKARVTKLGPDHPDTLTSRNNLAQAFLAAGRTAQAITLHEATLKTRELKLGSDHPRTLTSRNNLAEAYLAAGRTAEAITLHEATLKAREMKLGPDHPETLLSRNNLGLACLADHRPAEGEPLFRVLIERARKQFGSTDPRTTGAMAHLGMSLIQQGKWLAAEPVLRECLAIREKIQPDDWSTFNARSLLGGCLLGQKNYTDAEPLILAGYEGMKARESRIPGPSRPHIPEAAERVLQLYEAWGQKDKVAEWRAKLARPSDKPEHQP
jgi:serine/threonine protein kinase/tetratricopeptide (TPR) repeat protein